MEQAIADSENVALRLQIAETIAKYRSIEIAVTWYKSVIRIAPDCQEAHQALADYYNGIGDKMRAQFHEGKLSDAVPYHRSDQPDSVEEQG